MTNSRFDTHEHFAQVVEAWLHLDDAPGLEAPQRVASIMNEVDQTSQRRRWWPLPGVDRASWNLPGSWAAARTVATVALVLIAGSGLVYVASQPPQAPLAGSMLPTVVAQDIGLLDRARDAWNQDDLLELTAVYAPAASHRVLYHDRTARYSGRDQIAAIATAPTIPLRRIAGPFQLPDSNSGERRYLDVVTLAGGTPCLYWIRDARITRHDCIVPKTYAGRDLVAGDQPARVTLEQVDELGRQAWNQNDREAFEAAYSPEIIHRVAYDSRATNTVGREAYWQIVSHRAEPIEALAPRRLLPAPDGELRWAEFSNVGGGSLCTFWVEGSQIARHDCIVPTDD